MSRRGRTREAAEKAAAFLRLYETHGADLSITEFCRRFKQSRQSYSYWRQCIPAFKERFDAIREAHLRRKAGIEGKVEIPELTAEQSAFLKHYQESHSKVYALEAIGASPSDLTGWLANPIFQREYQEVEEWIQLRVEDALVEGAKEGSIQHAKIYLQSKDPSRYATKVAHLHKLQPGTGAEQKQIGAHWKDRLLAAKLREEKIDIIDAEVISESVQ